MRDLIAKQTAALMGPGSAMALYSPESLRSPRAEQEVLDAEDRGDKNTEILKNILSTLKKSLIVQEDMDASIRKLADSIDSTGVSSVNQSTFNAPTARKETLLPLGPTAMSVPLLPAPIKQEESKEAPITEISGEQQRESLVLLQKQTDLLEGILTALGGKTEGKPATQQTRPGSEDKGIGDVFKNGIKKLIPNLLKGFLKVGLVGLVAGLFSGIVDGFKEYFKSGDIGKALSTGIGGFLEFLTFGLFNKDDVEKWLKGAMDMWNNIGNYVDEYLITPINNFVDAVGKALDEYIVQPISNFIDTVGTLFKQYIMDPVSGFLESVTNVFSSITDSLVSFLNGFEIPKVSVKLPVVGEVSAGPWKPFAGIAEAIKGGTTPSAAPSAPPTNIGNAVAATSASNEAVKQSAPAASAPVVISAPSTNVQNSQNVTMSQPVRNPDMSFNRYMSRSRVIV